MGLHKVFLLFIGCAAYAADTTTGCTEADLDYIQRGVSLQDSGLQQDYAEAAAIYRTMAHLGCSEAMSRYAFLLREGLGVEQSESDAEYWDGRAAELRGAAGVGEDAGRGDGADGDPGRTEADTPAKVEETAGRLDVQDRQQIEGLVFLGSGLVLQTFVPE